MKKINIALLIGLLMTFSLTYVCGFAQTCRNLQEEVLRIHILANSDSPEDQALKLAARDAVLEECADLFAGEDTLAGAEAKAAANLERMETAAEKALRQRGCGDQVRAELVNMYFNTREYEEFTMPAGRYDAVRLVIGQGKGKNWWCVMFPSMCLPAAGDKLSGFGEEEQRLLGSKPAYEPRFALVEWWESRNNSTEEKTGPVHGGRDAENKGLAGGENFSKQAGASS